jgi:hypothetical protein
MENYKSKSQKRRERRKKAAPSAGGTSYGKRSARHKWVADFWSGRIKDAMEARKTYDQTAEEVIKFLGPNHGHLFDDVRTKKFYGTFGGSAVVSVPKVAQMRNALGPRLYSAKPVRTVTPETQDGVMLGLARTLGAYLNYSVKETKFVKHLRKSIDDGLLRGRGFLRQYLDPVRGLVTSKYVASTDVVIDPDFNCIEDAMWIAWRTREPMWMVEERTTEKWRIKELNKPASVPGVEDEDEKKNDHGTVQMVSVWTVLSKMGAGFRAGPKHKDMGEPDWDDSEDFVQLDIVQGHCTPLSEGPWDLPFYLDKDWPISYVDFVEPIDQLWPDSVFGQVLPLQKTIDLLTTSALSGCKNRDRLLVLGEASMDKSVKDVMRTGGPAEFAPVAVPSGKKLADMFQVLDFGNGSERTAFEREYLTGEMEGATGVNTALTGAQDDSAKERSAAASQIKNSATETRTADMKERAEEIHTDAARKEAITAKLILSEDEIAPYVGSDKINLFYVALTLPGGTEIPVRDPRTRIAREEAVRKDPEDRKAPLTLERVSPGASNYFESIEEAYEAALRVPEDIILSEDPRIIELGAALEIQKLAEDGLPLSLQLAPVTVQRVWRDTAGMTTDEVFRELSYEIASGGGIKINQQAEQANADNLVQTTLPDVLAMGDIENANKIREISDNAYEVPQDQRIRFTAPPAPVPGDAPSGQQNGGK